MISLCNIWLLLTWFLQLKKPVNGLFSVILLQQQICAREDKGNYTVCNYEATYRIAGLRLLQPFLLQAQSLEYKLSGLVLGQFIPINVTEFK
jgi:hypothetical protein